MKLLSADYEVAITILPSEGEWQFREAAMVSFHMRRMKPHFPRQEEGKYTHEPLLHCALLGEEGRSETVMIATLTGLRLLTVDTTTWRVNLNLPLRKVCGVQPEVASHSIVLQLVTRRRQASGRGGVGGWEERGGRRKGDGWLEGQRRKV